MNDQITDIDSVYINNILSRRFFCIKLKKVFFRMRLLENFFALVKNPSDFAVFDNPIKIAHSKWVYFFDEKCVKIELVCHQ